MTDIIPIGETKEKQPFEVEGIKEPGREFGPWAGGEFDFAAKHDVLYPLLRTAADIVPFASFAFPSGRQEFSELSPGGKVGSLALDAMMFLPFSWIGKGLKISARPVTSFLGRAGKRMPFRVKNIIDQPKPVLDNLAKSIDKFIYTTPEAKLIGRYDLTPLEIKAVKSKSLLNPDGSLVSTRPGFTKLFGNEGRLQTKIEKKVADWSIPREIQRIAHMKKEWEKAVGPYLQKGKYEVDEVFGHLAKSLYGEKEAAKLTLKNIGGKDFSQLLMHTLLNEGKIMRGYDIWSRHYLLPIRKVLGPKGLIKKIQQPLEKFFGAARTAAYIDIKNFHMLLGLRGIGSFKKSGRFIPGFSSKEFKEAGELAVKIDGMQGKGMSQKAIQGVMDGASTRNVQQIVKAHHELSDAQYTEFMKVRIPQLFSRFGANEEGINAIEAMFSRPGKALNKYINVILSSSANCSYETKAKVINNILDYTKGLAKKNPQWFGDITPKRFNRLLLELTPRQVNASIGFPNYLQNYTARIFEKAPRLAPKTRFGGIQKEASFKKTRTQEEGVGVVKDLNRIISSRASAQGKELYVYPNMGKLETIRKTLPSNLQKYVKHYFDRLLGTPSPVDDKVAQVINRFFGKSWDAQRVNKLAYQINDFIYLGGIGFKPFSAMRNYIQPLMMVPVDMGGVKDLAWFAKGYHRAAKAETRDYLKSIGAITEYSPDILFAPSVTNFGFAGKMQRFRDFGMWMFKCSDRHNRYVTGGAALEKWEYHFNKLAVRNSKGDFVMFGRGIKDFKNKLRLESRESWVRADIEALINKGTPEAFKEAKKIWVKDIIGDTQFLYGSIDSPLVNQVGGSVTKTAMVFQSWWMNYGSAMGKWAFRSGSVSTETQRLLNFMFATAVAYNIMEPIWGKGTAARTVGFGPLPLEADLPASWRPFAEGLKLVIEAGGIPMGVTDPETVKKRMKSVINTSLIGIPGGLFAAPVIKGAIREGLSGALKGIIKYRGGD